MQSDDITPKEAIDAIFKKYSLSYKFVNTKEKWFKNRVSLKITDDLGRFKKIWLFSLDNTESDGFDEICIDREGLDESDLCECLLNMISFYKFTSIYALNEKTNTVSSIGSIPEFNNIHELMIKLDML